MDYVAGQLCTPVGSAYYEQRKKTTNLRYTKGTPDVSGSSCLKTLPFHGLSGKRNG